MILKKRIFALFMTVCMICSLVAPVSAEESISVYVAEVNGVQYTSLQEAVDEANGETITLLADIEATEYITTNGTAVNINGNGKTITFMQKALFNDVNATNNDGLSADVSITNATISGPTAGSGYVAIFGPGYGNGKTVTIDGCTLTNMYTSVYCGALGEGETANLAITNTTYGDGVTNLYSVNDGTQYNVTFKENTYSADVSIERFDGNDGYTDDPCDEGNHSFNIVVNDEETSSACSICGTEIVHTHSSSIVKPATCTTSGVVKITCDMGCSATYESIPASHAQPTEGVETIPATCVEAGSVTYSCAECGEMVVEEISATGEHDFQEDFTEATCTGNSYAGLVCSMCGETSGDMTEIEGTALGHDYQEEITTPATCEEAGVETITCSRCDYEATEEIASTGHTWDKGVFSEADCTHGQHILYTCTICGETETEDTGLGEAQGHTPEVVPAVDATCASTGLTEGSKCSVCGEVLSEQTVVEMIAHTYESVVTAPTCSDGGYTTYTCSVCGDTYTADETEAVGDAHVKVVGSVMKPATCTTAGVAKMVCDVCGTAMGYGAIEASHDWTEGEVTTAPNCGTAGVKTFTCSVCSDTYTESLNATGEHTYGEEQTQINADGKFAVYQVCETCGNLNVLSNTDNIEICVNHTYENGICTVCGSSCEHSYAEEVTTPATCTTAGVKTLTCACGDVKTEEIPATEHTAEVVAGKDATCTETGLTEGSKCSVCGETLVSQEEIPAIEHSYGADDKCTVCGVLKADHEHSYAEEVTTPATCTTAGVKTLTCACGDVKTEEIPATEHTAEVVAGKDATCTETGLTEGSKCSVCGETLVSQEEIPATGHTYGGYTYIPETDEYVQACTVCGAHK